MHFRLISAPIQKIAEEECLFSNREKFTSESGKAFWKACQKVYETKNPDQYSVVTYASSGIHAVSLREWLLVNEKYYK